MKNLFTICFILSFVTTSFSETYFIHPKDGNDKNKGIVQSAPWKSFKNLEKVTWKAGDIIALAGGFEIKGSMIFKNVKGTPKNPILICSYTAENSKTDIAIINALGFENGILLENASYFKIENVLITANGGNTFGKVINKGMRCGILVTTTKPIVSENIQINNVTISKVYFENENFVRPEKEVNSANGTQSYGYGIRFINRSKNSVIKNVTLKKSLITDVGHTGIKFTSSKGGIQNITISGNQILKTGGPGVQIGGVIKGHVFENTIDKSGSKDDSRKWGRGSGLWTWSCDDILVEKNQFLNANGPADSAGIHIDFNCNNIYVQYNLSRNNAGGFCEILGNNYNCTYRYNVSINDGYRVKGKNGAFQEGKLFWLSGFNGKNNKRKGPFHSYFYNNTMYVNADILTKIAIDRAASGVLIANNIFHIVGKSKSVKGDQYRPEKDGVVNINNVLFKNNLYLNVGNWPKNIPIQDTNPFYGDPQFTNKGGLSIADYVPKNIKLIKDKGIEIPTIPNDSIGLKIGLKVDTDIVGNKIIGNPDLGAFELK